MILYFIRHGQSANNLLYEEQGHDDHRTQDPELTDYGRRQAQSVGRFLANGHNVTPAASDALMQDVGGFHLTHLYASPMVRAMDTAQAIAQATGLTPVVWPEVHETGGIWLKNPETEERCGLPGADRTFFETRYPQFVLPDGGWAEGGWWNRPYERFNIGCIERAKQLLVDLQARHGNTDDRVAVVSHGAFYNALMKTMLGISMETALWFTLHNTGLTRIEFADETRLSYSNRVDFLPPELIT